MTDRTSNVSRGSSPPSTPPDSPVRDDDDQVPLEVGQASGDYDLGDIYVQPDAKNPGYWEMSTDLVAQASRKFGSAQMKELLGKITVIWTS